MKTSDINQNGHIRKLTSAQAKKLFDRQARFYLKISGETFLRRWKKGEYKNQDTPEVMRVAMMIPFGR